MQAINSNMLLTGRHYYSIDEDRWEVIVVHDKD